MIIRPVTQDDTAGISDMLGQIAAAGKRTAPTDPVFVQGNYVADPVTILCSLAVDDDGTILGLQVLKLATEGNRFDTPLGWGFVGTHVAPSAARRGIGVQLFQVTKAAAAEAGLKKVEAFIAETNAEGLAYYEAMGFRTYRLAEGVVCKAYDVEQPGR